MNQNIRGRTRKAVRIACIAALLCRIFWVSPLQAANGNSIRITDATGRTVSIGLPVKRLVALNSDVLEVIRSLKAESLVKGVFSEISRDPSFWPGLKDVTRVGSWRAPDAEIIAELNPDLIITYSRNPGPGFAEKMASLGIQVLRLDFYKIHTLEREVQTLGRLLEREREAGKLCAWYRKNLGLIRERLEKIDQKPDVYIESYSDYHTTGPGSGGDEMCVLAGGHNIAAEFSIPYPQVTPEWVISRNPRVIVKAASRGHGYALNDPAPLNQKRAAIMRRPAWHHITAVETGNVHVMDSAIWAGSRAVIGIAYMAGWIHPGVFKDLDPEALHQEYMRIFQGIEYSGAFVSRPVEVRGR